MATHRLESRSLASRVQAFSHFTMSLLRSGVWIAGEVPGKGLTRRKEEHTSWGICTETST